ncbi:sporulation-delaying protein SdpB family protein [Streptomyces sp. QL37]|uniref:sporulation-delaying protein SdpB family protein n=1 Tax=Streptomyces sp. QL37 TaxID=2093747 RepID=UPI0021CB13AA|nr:sporulation-delaying protein SdpB family protein [Streptomyces sp. QL37]
MPWTNVYGLARTLLALGTLGTLAFSSTGTLFRPVATQGDYPICTGPMRAGVFCLAPENGLTETRWLCVLVLLVVASGWRPRWTALPHAWVSFSLFSGIAIADGGDQVTVVLSSLLALAALGDPRRWHWQALPEGEAPRRRRTVLMGATGLVLARIQMSFLYFQSCVAKLPHAEWADGTAMWYWGHSLAFGAPGPLQPLVEPVLASAWGVALLTWIPLAIEIGLAASLLLAQHWRWRLFAAGIIFHLSIAAMMGLWSFALAMIGGLVVLCFPLGSQLRVVVPESVRRMLRRDTAGPGLPAGRGEGAERNAEDGEGSLQHASTAGASGSPASSGSDR